MTEATISCDSLDQIRELCGIQDRNLKRVRDIVGVTPVARGDQIRLIGTDSQIRRGLAVFEELKSILNRRGQLAEAEVLYVLDTTGQEPQAAATKPASDDILTIPEKGLRIAHRTEGQAVYGRALRDKELVFCVGPAGCGKTYLAVASAIEHLRTEKVSKIVLARPAIEAGERLGFLPGDMQQKVNPYMRPLQDALYEMLGVDQVRRYIERDVVEILPLAFMRGRTLNRTYMILDEGQNCTVTQMKMFLTRMGEGSRIAVTGDVTQIDLPPNVPNGLTDAIDRLSGIEGIGTVRLTGADIVRHRLVREIVAAYDTGDSDASRPPRRE